MPLFTRHWSYTPASPPFISSKSSRFTPRPCSNSANSWGLRFTAAMMFDANTSAWLSEVEDDCGVVGRRLGLAPLSEAVRRKCGRSSRSSPNPSPTSFSLV